MSMSGILPETYVDGFHDAEAVRLMKYNELGKTGLKVSALSLGAGGFSDLYGQFSLDECKKTVEKAIKSGINYIDTAPWYGQGVSESTLGKCLKDIPRQAYYIATKVGRYEKDPKYMFEFSGEKTRQSLHESLARLQIDHVDIVQIHDVEFAPSLEYLIENTLPVLEELVQAGKARFVGITGYPVSVLAELVERSPARFDTVLSYARMSLIDRTLERYLGKFQGMGVVCASALGMGLLTNAGPQPWHPASQQIKDVCEEARSYCKANNVELAKLAMHYVYTLKGLHTQLVGMNNVELLDANLDVLLNGLNEKELEILKYLQKSVFPKLGKNVHWEGLELEGYLNNISKF